MALSYQKITGMLLISTDETQLYAVPANVEIRGEVIVCNIGAAATAISLAWCDRGHGDVAAESKDWILRGVSVPVGDEPLRVPVCLGAGESLRVKAGDANALAVTLCGMKRTI